MYKNSHSPLVINETNFDQLHRLFTKSGSNYNINNKLQNFLKSRYNILKIKNITEHKIYETYLQRHILNDST